MRHRYRKTTADRDSFVILVLSVLRVLAHVQREPSPGTKQNLSHDRPYLFHGVYVRLMFIGPCIIATVEE